MPIDTKIEYFYYGSIKPKASHPSRSMASPLDAQAVRLLHHLDVLVNRFLSARFPKSSEAPDVSPADFRLMSILDRSGSATMTDLAERLDLPLSTATNRVDRLVKIGILERLRSDLDRRIVEVRLSDHGRELVVAGNEIRLSMGRGMLGALTSGEREILIELMQKMSDHAAATPPASKQD